MKAKKKHYRILAFGLAAAAAVAALVALTPSEKTPVPMATISQEDNVLSQQEREEYEQLQARIDKGDCVGFARQLLEGGVSENLYAYLKQKDAALIDRVLVDAMVEFGRSGEQGPLVQLRKLGFVSDSNFQAYWKEMGTPVPEETDSGVDGYLVHELHMAYLRDVYALRSIREMRTEAVLDDGLHEALKQKLGFDYMDEAALTANGVDTVYMLTKAEREAYDSMLEAIDQGDYVRAVSGMLRGEVTQPVYRKLMEEDAKIMDSIIAMGMASLAEEGRFRDLVQLCVDGYVSDACYGAYWALEGVPVPENAIGEEALLYELELIYHQNDENCDVLEQLWRSGLLSDALNQKLMDRLGVDYTQDA